MTGWIIDGPAEVAWNGAASLDGTRASVCGNWSRNFLGGLERGTSQVHAANNTREASVPSYADVVEKDQMGGDKPASVIGSPMYQTFCIQTV